jgi:hypothetical protein
VTTPDVEDDMTELVDADFPRVDLVGKGANGIPRFLIAKQDGESAGLLEPEFVRDLIAKAEPEPADEQVTMTGSPAAIAKLIHGAPVRRSEPEDVAKKKLSSAGKNDLPDSAFAFIESGGKKDADGKTTPRSLRHFPIHDEAHVKAALSRIAGGAEFGDKAIGKVRSAARKFGIDVAKKEAAMAGDVTKGDAGDMLDAQTDGGTDGLDPTVPLAAPEDDAPGDPTDPGSPAWEAIDAATAQKWTSIAVRLKNALAVMADREMLEAASADPGDAENAFDLQDAMCAVDYVLGTLASFAVGEQAESDLGAEAMEMIGKALAGFDAAPLEQFEGLVSVAKAGRVLSSANESLIRTAGESLQTVLASLPQAPIADDITKETAVAADETKPAGEPQDVAKDAAEPAPATEPETVAKDAGAPAEEGVAKAGETEGKAKMVAVFDSKGDLVGVCDPGDITPIAGADAPTANEEEPAAEAPPADPADLTPAPAAAAGTPADDVAKSDGDEDPQAVLKSTVTEAVREALGTDPVREDVRKQADVIAKQSEEIEALKARLVTVEETPAAPRVFTNGATPPADQMRGQDRGARQADVAKARERKAELYSADAPQQARIAKEMQADAIDALSAIHAGR